MFKELAKLLPNDVTVTMNTRKNSDETLTVTTSFSGPEGSKINTLPPYIIKGTADELEADLLNVMFKPLEKAVGVITNIQFFEGQLAKAQEVKEKKKNATVTAEANKKEAPAVDLFGAADIPIQKKEETPALVIEPEIDPDDEVEHSEDEIEFDENGQPL